MMLLTLVLALMTLSSFAPSAWAQPEAISESTAQLEAQSEAPGNQLPAPAPEPKPISLYELRYFDMPDGGFVELADCEVPRRGRLSGYSCYVFNLGRQGSNWVAGDALELGVRYRPFDDDTWISAGAAYSILGTLVGIIACDTDGDDTCEKTRLPMEGYVALGVRGVLPIASYGISASAQLRYHGSFSGDVGYEAPQGAAIAVGLGVALR